MAQNVVNVGHFRRDSVPADALHTVDRNVVCMSVALKMSHKIWLCRHFKRDAVAAANAKQASRSQNVH